MANDPLDLLLVSRYALLVSLTHLIPIPIVDALAASLLRARLTRLQLQAAGIAATGRDTRMLGGASAGGCLGLLWSVVVWPIKKLLRYLLWVLLVKAMIDTFSDVVARAVLVDEAIRCGALPGPAVPVRAAMQRALRGVSTRPFERAVGLIFETTRGETWRWFQLARSAMRLRARSERAGADVASADRDPLAESLESVAQTLARAVWIPEVHEQIRAALRREAAALPRTGAPVPVVTAAPEAEPDAAPTGAAETDADPPPTDPPESP